MPARHRFGAIVILVALWTVAAASDASVVRRPVPAPAAAHPETIAGARDGTTFGVALHRGTACPQNSRGCGRDAAGNLSGYV
jgi:hypothetical protein